MIRSHYTHIQLELLEPREGVNVYTKWLGGAGLCLPSHNDNIIDESGDFALAKSPLSTNPMLKEGLAHHKE